MADRAEEHAPRFLALGHVFHVLFVLDDVLLQFGAFVFDEEDMDEAVADEAAERVKRPERPNDLQENGSPHCEAEYGYHDVSFAHDILTSDGFHESDARHQNTCGDQRVVHGIAQESCDIFALRIIIEQAGVEDIYEQHHDVQGQKHIPEPGEYPRPPSAGAQIGDNEMAHRENGYGSRDEKGHCVEVQGFCPAKSRKYTPESIRYVEIKNGRQKAAILVRAADVRRLPPVEREHVEVDDQMDHDRQECDYGIEVILHGIT